MYKVMLLVPFFFLTVNPTRSQEYNHHSADSVTWDLYLKGDWDNLVKTGNTILRQDIDFKTLQQRLGYAYFQKGNYLLSRWHYEKALAYDRSDETTNLYLYYTGLNMGDESYTRFYAGKQPEAVKKEYKLHALRLVDEVETEYNYKTGSDMYARSGINFVRLGFNSQIGYRLSLYQTVSNFRQIFNSNTNVNQNGYYALLKWNPAARFSVSGGLHLISTVAGANQYTTRMFYGKIAYQKHLFDVSLSGSTYANNGSYNQAGFHAGITIPQLNRFYLHSDLYYLAGAAGNNMVYNQGVGFMPMKRLWLEVFSTEGKQQNFVDMNGVYIYNSGDYSTFKTGGTLFYYLNNHIRLFGNYSYDTKYYNNNQFYPQHSITGGIIWKL